jgi:L-glutamine-phosphate cytidylyltransferase
MRAVILAAGRGGRLRGAAGDRPKCLVRVGARTLVERQIQALRGCGVDEIAVVAGYHAADVRAVCGSGVDLVHNDRYATTNSLYSLWLARDLLADGFVVLNGDVLFHPQLLSDLMTARYEDALLLAARLDDAPFSDEEMKVQVRRGCVVDIDKRMPASQADGENIGVVKFGRDGAAVMIELLSEIVAADGVREWLPRAFAAFVERRPLYVVESRGFPWIEIDFPEDYWRACSEVLPAIEAAAPAAVLTGQPAARASEQLGRTLRHV